MDGCLLVLFREPRTLIKVDEKRWQGEGTNGKEEVEDWL